MPNEYVYAGAYISLCRRYRRTLIRRWEGLRDDRSRFALWVMLNPSTATGEEDDPTVRRCVQFTKDFDLGLKGLVIENLWDFRATDPQVVKEQEKRSRLDFSEGEKEHPSPCSEDNDYSILRAAKRAGIVVAAWGKNALEIEGGSERIHHVLGIIRGHSDVHILQLNKDGQPAHPLMLPGSLRPYLWWRQI